MTYDEPNFKEDEQAATNWACELLSRDNWCILDTETTGLGNWDEIVEVAIIDSKGTTLLNQRVKPTCPISDAAANIHGILYKHLNDCPTFDQVLLPILKAIGNRDVVIYNANYDIRLIRQSIKPYGIQLAFPTSDRRGCRIFTNGGSILCAMNWYSQWVGEWNDYHGNYKWQRLPAGDHSALGDCLATLDVIKKMAGMTAPLVITEGSKSLAQAQEPDYEDIPF